MKKNITNSHYYFTIFLVLLFFISILSSSQPAFAEITTETASNKAFHLNSDSDLIGQDYKVIVTNENTPEKIAEEYAVSIKALRQVNAPAELKNLYNGAIITIPNTFILPAKPLRNGIVINIPEKRLYYFTPDQQSVYIFHVALGRTGWFTPLANTHIKFKQAKPIWYVPKSIREYTFATKKVLLPAFVKPGPDNPLGPYALYLDLNGFLIHGTNDPKSIGKLVSSGCIRLHNKDITLLYSLVPIGTAVTIVHEPYKAAVYHNNIYFEAYMPIAHPRKIYEKSTLPFQQVIKNAIGAQQATINWEKVKKTIATHSGVPIKIGYL